MSSLDLALDWLSANTLIQYPFKEDTSLVAASGFELPRNLLLDAIVYGGTGEDRVYLSKLLTDAESAFLFFSSVELGSVVAEIEVDLVGTSVKTVSTSVAVDPDDYEMRVVWGPGLGLLTSFLDEDFTLASAELEPHVVAPRPKQVLSLAWAGEELARITGDIDFADGYNMEVVLDEDTNTFTFNSGAGFGLGPFIDCPELTEVPRRLRTINGIQADQTTRNFQILGDDCVEVRHYPETGMIVIHDHCRECCDCDRLEDLDTRITALESA